MDFDREAVVQSFAAESEEGLAAMESILLEMEDRPEQDQAVASIFRVVHTLKGNALLLGFETLSVFAHEVENVLDRLRSKTLTLSPAVTSLLLASVDALRAAVAACVAGVADVVPRYEQLRKQLEQIAAGESAHEIPADVEESADNSAPAELPASATRSKTLRVSVEKLDKLLNLTGEISIARGRVRQMLEKLGADDVSSVLDAHADIDRLFLELQETIMRARMVPLGPVFRGCVRAVHDMAEKLGKKAELEISGEDVEVDTSVTELIRDPLMHMVRNALDHGIELPDQRRTAGKHPRGHLELKAEHQGGTVVIELSDDGRGIDLGEVREKAKANGWLQTDERASDQELYRLLFRAGFSTSDKVTDVSGRGVGLEVVRRNIEALRGTVQVSSQPGVGTTMTIRLPLTLAILDGFLVGVGTETYVTPLENAVECLDFPAEHVTGPKGSAVIDFRGRPLPLLRLRNVFDVEGNSGTREKVLIVRQQNALAGLIVDEFYGQRQVVIKSLGRLSQSAYGVSGSTILGDGKVALLLDVARLMNDAVELTNNRA